MTHSLQAAFTVLFLAGAVLNAQDSTPPTIHVTTRLVQVNVVVHDKAGKAVPGLKKEDFTLLERGREKAIALFSDDSEVSRPVIADRLPPDVYSNRITLGKGPVSVLLFDASTTRLTDQPYARGQILNFIRQIQPGERVAIYALNGGGVRVLHDFSDNPAQLARAISSYGKLLSANLELDPTVVDWIDQVFPDANQPTIDFDRKVQCFTTFKDMEAIARHLTVIPGRKSLIWVTGFPVDFNLTPGDPCYEEALRTTRTLTDANVALYPVDARGLMVDPRFAPSLIIPSYKAAKTPNEAALLAAQLTFIYRPSGHDTMHFLADETGGRTLIDRNDIDTAIKVAVDDSRDTYTLGFYSPDEDWDGKFHEIKVKLNRPGTELRYRKGFVALADPALDVQDLKAEVSNTLSSVIEATAIDIRAHVERVAPSSLSLTLRVAADNVQFTERGGGWTSSLEFVFAQFGPDGSRLSIARQPLALNISSPTHDEFLRHGIILTKTMDLVANAERLTVVAVDSSTGRIGSLHVPLKSK
jgi:VWFA-related protein